MRKEERDDKTPSWALYHYKDVNAKQQQSLNIKRSQEEAAGKKQSLPGS